MEFDFIVPLLELIVVSALVGFVLCWVAWGLYKSPVAGAVLILALHLAEAYTFIPALNLGLLIYPSDIVFTTVAISTALRIASGRWTVSRPIQYFGAFGCVVAISVLSGLLANGTKAGVEARTVYGVFFTILYFATFRFDALQFSRVLRVVGAAAGVLVLLALVRWTADTLDLDWGPDIYHAPVTKVGERLRVLNAAGASLLATYFLVLVFRSTQGKLGYFGKLSAVVLFACVVVLQHRSVWVATIAGLAIMALRDIRISRRLGKNAIVATIVGALVLVPVLAMGLMSGVSEGLERSIADATSTRHTTFTWRIESWQTLLGSWTKGGIRDVVIGQPYGSGFERQLGEGDERQMVNVAPHSYYVTSLLRVGIIGAILLALFYFSTLRHLVDEGLDTDRGRAATLLFVIVAAQLVFDLVYDPSPADAIFLGLAVSMVPRRERNAQKVGQIHGVEWLKSQS